MKRDIAVSSEVYEVPRSYQLDGRFQVPPNATPDTRVCFCFNLPDDAHHMAIFWGMLETLCQPRFWDSPDEATRYQMANYYRQIFADNRACFDEVLQMANRGCGCDGEPITRYNQDGLLEESTDGGETWETTLADPRLTGTIVPPPLWLLTPGDHSCEAAITARANYEAMSNEILGNAVDIGVPAFAEVVALIVCTFSAGVACAIAQLIATFAVIVIQIGASAIEAALTTEMWDAFQCILFCHSSDDAVYSESQWQAVKDDIAAQFDGNQEFWLWNLVNMLGPVGLTNMARTGVTADGDCDDCSCNPCAVEGIWMLESDVPEVWVQAPEVSPNVVRLSSYVPNSIPNGQYIVWKYGTPTQGNNCCYTLGYQNPIPSDSEIQQAIESRCDETTAPHLWPWLGVPVCGFGGTIVGFNIPAYTVDLRLDPDEGCP